VKVNATDRIHASISYTSGYSLFSSSSASRLIGQWSLSVSEILPRLRVQDRDTEGLVYASPVIGFDIVQDGKMAGRVFLSFETKTPPRLFNNDDESMVSVMGSAERWEGPLGWKRGRATAAA